MKSARLLALSVVAGMISCAWAAPYDEPALVRAISAAPTSPVQTDSPAALAVRQATDPSSAIAAYSSAMQSAPGDLGAKRAFVQRMIDFGMPEMVDTQAQELLKGDPRDGLAWAVSAYMNAKRSRTDAAFTDIAQAVRYQPNNTFVVRTAAQLVAWYDTQPQAQRTTSPEARASIESVRGLFVGNATFADAYGKASETYREAAASAPAAQAPVAAAESPQYDTQQPTYVNNYYSTYTTPYDDGYAYWYPRAYYPGTWWWPTFSSVVIINRDFDHHRRCDDLDFFRHHDRDASFVRRDVLSPARVNHGRFLDPVRVGTPSPIARTPAIGQRDPVRVGTPGSFGRTPTIGQRDPVRVGTPGSFGRTPTIGQRDPRAPTTVAPPGWTRTPSVTSFPGRAPIASPTPSRATPMFRGSMGSPIVSHGSFAPRGSTFTSGGRNAGFSAPSGGMARSSPMGGRR